MPIHVRWHDNLRIYENFRNNLNTRCGWFDASADSRRKKRWREIKQTRSREHRAWAIGAPEWGGKIGPISKRQKQVTNDESLNCSWLFRGPSHELPRVRERRWQKACKWIHRTSSVRDVRLRNFPRNTSLGETPRSLRTSATIYAMML